MNIWVIQEKRGSGDTFGSGSAFHLKADTDLPIKRGVLEY
jgi:hypothetical protein